MNIKAMVTILGFSAGAAALVLAADVKRTPATPAAAPTATPVTVAPPAAAPVAAAEPAPKAAITAKAPAKTEAPTPQPAAAKVADVEPSRVITPAEPAATIPQQQLSALLAPIALYPDQLLSQILMAATYPLEVIEAARWVARPDNEGLNGDRLAEALEAQDWDPSVKALVAFPHILKMMDSDLAWLAKLGDAFLAQETEVMDAVQRLRREAQAADKLDSDTRRRITTTEGQIIIEPANPEVVYVPFYDPREAYGVWRYNEYPPFYIPPPLGYAYTPGIYYNYISVSPFWGWSRWDWHNRRIHIIDVPKYRHHNRGRDPIDRDVWRHDPSHRRGVGTGDQFRGPFNDRRNRGGEHNPGTLINAPPVNPREPDFRSRHLRPPEAGRPEHPDTSARTLPMRPKYRDFRGAPPAEQPPAELPDITPPLPATAALPAITPPIPATPPVAVPDRTDQMRGRWSPRQPQPDTGPYTGDDDVRRMRQFQDRSISAPPLSNIPPTQRRFGDPSISAPPLTNVQPAEPPRAPRYEPPVYRAPVPIAPAQIAPPQYIPSPAAPAPAYAAPVPSPAPLGAPQAGFAPPRLGGGYRGGFVQQPQPYQQPIGQAPPQAAPIAPSAPIAADDDRR